jgi:hypothetical protein
MSSFPFFFAVLAWFAYFNGLTTAVNLNTTSVPFRIMALGASVTFGVGSTTGDSYRKDLEDLLKANGDTVGYVGTKRNGNFSDNAVEATSGFVISQIAAAANVAVSLNSQISETNLNVGPVYKPCHCSRPSDDQLVGGVNTPFLLKTSHRFLNSNQI